MCFVMGMGYTAGLRTCIAPGWSCVGVRYGGLRQSVGGCASVAVPQSTLCPKASSIVYDSSRCSLLLIFSFTKFKVYSKFSLSLSAFLSVVILYKYLTLFGVLSSCYLIPGTVRV